MERKSYKDIERFKEKYSEAISVGDLIHVSEKIDGANASFGYDAENDKVVCYSRNRELDEVNNLNGFYEWVMSIPKEIVKQATLNGRDIMFGEWLIPHTVKYPEDKYKKFYLFDVWDRVNNCYCSQTQVTMVAHSFRVRGIEISEPRCFFFGRFSNWIELLSFVGQTSIGAMPCGEGIVIKNQSHLLDENSRRPAYLKVVSEKFSEVHKSKPKKELNPETLKKKEGEFQLAQTIVTERRVQKMIEKMIDEGELPFDWDEQHLKYIAKNLPRKVYHDCVKEEPETVNKIENFGKVCGKIVMNIARTLIK